MGLVLFIFVVPVAAISVALSWWLVVLCRAGLRKAGGTGVLLKPILILTPIVWGLVYWVPVDYGGGRNFDYGLFFLVCCTKTALFFLAPAIVSVPITISIVSKKSRSE
jgi:hypothetical protein